MFNIMQRLFPTFFALGVFFNFTFGYNLGWRQLATFNLFLPILFVPIAFSSTESPPWLLDKGRFQDAKEALKINRPSKYDVVKELYMVHKTRQKIPVSSFLEKQF